MHRDSGPPHWKLVQKKLAKRPADNQMDGWTDILYCHSGYLKPWPAATCAARNYVHTNELLLPI